jgi:Flp pilus assembly protein TadG
MLTPATGGKTSARCGLPALRRLCGDAAGVSAVEFALILPIMLTLWVGFAEMAHAVDNWRKVTLLARTVADLTSQGDTADPIASATMSDILAASTAVLRPFGAGTAKMVVSAMAVNTAASLVSPWVCSSVSSDNNASARPTGVARDLSIPPGFNVNGNRYVMAEVTMPYAPMLGTTLVRLVSGVGNSIPLNASFVWPVRNGIVHKSINATPEVTMPGGAACP